jgi:hypothetical protein
METYTCSCRPAIAAVSITETSGTWGAPVTIAGPQLTPAVLIASLSGIACQPNVCVAVGSGGSYNDSDPYENPIATTWSSGTWSSMGIEQFNPAAGNNETNASWLNGVACGSATQCFAVGYAGAYEDLSGPVSLYPYSTTLTPTRPIVAPGAPAGFGVVPMIGGAQVTWAPPSDDGGAPVRSYTATASPGVESCTTTSYGCTLTGLTNGHEYVVSITDSNGTSASSPVYFAFFAGAIPTPPTNLNVFRMRSAAVISWTRATAPTGELVRYLANVHGKGHELHTCASVTRSCSVRGLVKGRTYVAVLYAIDASGKSSPALIRFVSK